MKGMFLGGCKDGAVLVGGRLSFKGYSGKVSARGERWEGRFNISRIEWFGDFSLWDYG